MIKKLANLMAPGALCILLVHCAASGSGPNSSGEEPGSESATSSSSSSTGTGGAGGMSGTGGASGSSTAASSGGGSGSPSSSSGGSMMGKPLVVLNEIESNGGMPGDWVELHNGGTATADVSGWVLMDNDDTHVYVIPDGTMIAPGEYLVLEEADFGYGLGASDSVRLFDPMNNLHDEYTWTDHASTTYGRCPNGPNGSFETTTEASKGAANKC